MIRIRAEYLPQEGRAVGHLAPELAGAVTIATYNEAENLPELLERLLGLEPQVGVVVVDDASPDGTGELGDEWAARVPGRVVVIHR
ncbi:MAG: glycosyltransferase, partial [Armatimonadetes bacterium]|nr:glycosyltransferase [Armatimonadota bacterium]